MATAATFNDIFVDYYNLYRGDGSTPTSSDPEWTIALRLANNAIDAWFHDPGMMWNELFTTCQADGAGAVKVITAGTQTYAGPTDMLKTGGFIKLTNPATNGGYVDIRLYDPPEIQNLDPNILAAYFTGDPQHGWTLNFQGDLTNYNAYTIDYVYYKKPTPMALATDKPEMANTAFMVHHMLANRFRNSRNWPAYQTAMRDAQDALKSMETQQNSGTWFNHWRLSDPAGTSVGGSGKNASNWGL